MLGTRSEERVSLDLSKICVQLSSMVFAALLFVKKEQVSVYSSEIIADTSSIFFLNTNKHQISPIAKHE